MVIATPCVTFGTVHYFFGSSIGSRVTVLNVKQRVIWKEYISKMLLWIWLCRTQQQQKISTSDATINSKLIQNVSCSPSFSFLNILCILFGIFVLVLLKFAKYLTYSCLQNTFNLTKSNACMRVCLCVCARACCVSDMCILYIYMHLYGMI